MNLEHELAKIEANQDMPLLLRSLDRAEIDSLVADGSITPPELIPVLRCRSRISMPTLYGASSFGLRLSSRRIGC